MDIFKNKRIFLINIELNNKMGIGIKNRNVVYACKVHSSQLLRGDNRYSKIGKTIQINLNNFNCNEHGLVDKYFLKNEDGKILTEKFEIDFVDIAKAKKKEYNENEEKLARWCRALSSVTYNELINELGDDLMENIAKEKLINEVNKYNDDDEVIALYSDYTKEELERNTLLEEGMQQAQKIGFKKGLDEGIKEGIDKRNIEIVSNLSKFGMSIDDISKITELNIEQIKKII